MSDILSLSAVDQAFLIKITEQAGAITLRQHYAGIALPEVMAEYHQSLRNGDSDAYSGWRLDVAKEAFMMADAMIEAGKQ